MKKLPLILAAVFFLFIAYMVFLADQGRLPGFITALYDFPYGDKLGHFLLMGGLSLFVNLALPTRSARARILAMLVITLLVALEEGSQIWFGTRHSDLGDFAASFAGIICLGQVGWWLRDVNWWGKEEDHH